MNRQEAKTTIIESFKTLKKRINNVNEEKDSVFDIVETVLYLFEDFSTTIGAGREGDCDTCVYWDNEVCGFHESYEDCGGCILFKDEEEEL